MGMSGEEVKSENPCPMAGLHSKSRSDDESVMTMAGLPSGCCDGGEIMDGFEKG